MQQKKILKTGYQHGRTPRLPLAHSLELWSFADETLYYGDLLQHQPHGHGIMIYPDEIIYEGQFKKGQPTDSGVFVFSDGSFYIGQVNVNGPHGTGTYMGTPLEGGQETDRDHQGPKSLNVTNTWDYEDLDLDCDWMFRKIWPPGSKYTGSWVDGQMFGNGTYLWPNGNVYTGEWRDNKMCGHGRYNWSNGKSIECNFLNNQKHGKAIIRMPDGISTTKTYRYNQEVKSF